MLRFKSFMKLLNRNIFQPARFAAGWSKGTFRFEAVYPVFTVGGPKKALFWALGGPGPIRKRQFGSTRKPQMKMCPGGKTNQIKVPVEPLEAVLVPRVTFMF